MAGKKILVVDDEEAIISLLTQVFSRAGYSVFSTDNAESAIALLENEKINVMFFDLNLPEMNGIELCKKVKKIMPIAIIYALTGYASLFELAECRDAGFEDYFKKPVNSKVLLRAALDSFEKLERWKNG